MDQKVKLQISSDLEDVTRVSSVLLDEALLHVNDLVALLNEAKKTLRDLNIGNPEELQKLKVSLQFLTSTRIPMSKIDNRLADVVAVVDGLDKILNGDLNLPEQTKEIEENDNVTTGWSHMVERGSVHF